MKAIVRRLRRLEIARAPDEQASHRGRGEQIAAQEKSGMTVKRFCQQQGVSEHSFYAWRKRLRSRKPGPP